jgi:hypothetical protein
MRAMATLKKKMEAERVMRELLEQNGMPEPDAVEYGYQCIRFFWYDTKTVVVIDIDEEPDLRAEIPGSPPGEEDGRNNGRIDDDDDEWGYGAEYMGLGDGLFGEGKSQAEGRGLPPQFN